MRELLDAWMESLKELKAITNAWAEVQAKEVALRAERDACKRKADQARDAFQGEIYAATGWEEPKE